MYQKPKQNLYRDAIEGARERHNGRLTEKSSWFKKKVVKDGEKQEKSDAELRLPILKHPGVNVDQRTLWIFCRV